MTWMDRVSAYARTKFDLPGDWQAYYFSVQKSGGLMIHGSIPRALKSGPRKGSRTWRDKTGFAAFTLTERDLAVIDEEPT